MQKIVKIFLGITVLIGIGIVAFPQLSLAGVAVSPAINQPTEPLLLGETYDLGWLTVKNTGNTPGYFGVRCEPIVINPRITWPSYLPPYISGLPLLPPPEQWFSFNPQNFYLEPGQIQISTVELTIPEDAQIAGYLCIIGGYQFYDGEKGGTAGVLLYFTLEEVTIPMKFFRIRELSFTHSEKRGDKLNSAVGKFILGEGNNGIDLEKDKKTFLVGDIRIPEEKIKIIKIPERFRKGEQYLFFVQRTEKDINGEDIKCPEPGKIEISFKIGDDLGKTTVELKSVGEGKVLRMVHHSYLNPWWGVLERTFTFFRGFWR